MIFLSEDCSVDDTREIILKHLRDSNRYAGFVWTKFSYSFYCYNELNPFQKYIFQKTIDEMINEGVFTYDDDYNLIVTEVGQDEIYPKL